ncbi:uncharacterized protein LOC136028473 [Artemia franciscana]|uniref:uncharacterized protein LOC136028473 n=1 Tax=Artemia franciscana TaxID=6661 RepID=UPI0032DA63F9
MSIPSKLMSTIVLQQKLDQHLRDEQHGFQSGRSCVDLIFTVRMLVEDSREWNKKLYLLFIDLEKAFDSADREILWKILKYYGIPPKIVELSIALDGLIKPMILDGQENAHAYGNKSSSELFT